MTASQIGNRMIQIQTDNIRAKIASNPQGTSQKLQLPVFTISRPISGPFQVHEAPFNRGTEQSALLPVPPKRMLKLEKEKDRFEIVTPPPFLGFISTPDSESSGPPPKMT